MKAEGQRPSRRSRAGASGLEEDVGERTPVVRKNWIRRIAA